jgi:hypothetical protein
MNIASMPNVDVQVKVLVAEFHDVIVMVPWPTTFTTAPATGSAFHLASNHVWPPPYQSSKPSGLGPGVS